MYCPPEYPYHTLNGEYGQHYQTQSYTGQSLNHYNSNIQQFSPTGSTPDRPSASFRIEDILLQNKGGPPHSQGTAYESVYPVQYYPNYNNGMFSHGCLAEREFVGAGNPAVSNLPYFRLRPNLRQPNGRKCRKPRTVFSELQLMVLEREFNEHKYLSTPQRTKLADKLGLNQTQVKTWYQNRRMKWKKESSEKKLPINSDISETRDTPSLSHSLVEQIQHHSKDKDVISDDL